MTTYSKNIVLVADSPSILASCQIETTLRDDKGNAIGPEKQRWSVGQQSRPGCGWHVAFELSDREGIHRLPESISADGFISEACALEMAKKAILEMYQSHCSDDKTVDLKE